MRIVYFERADGRMVGINPDLVRAILQPSEADQSMIYFDNEHFVKVKQSAIDAGAMLTSG